jgi:V8-like Glu-specific endopeptidase
MADPFLEELGTSSVLGAADPGRPAEGALPQPVSHSATGADPGPVAPPMYDGERDERLPPASGQLEGMVPDSERTQVTDTRPHPWRSICHLELTYENGKATASGCLVDPGVVLTAAHVVNHHELGRAREVIVYPARFAGSPVYPPQRSTDVRCHEAWTRALISEHDYGVVLLRDRSAFKPYGTFQMQALSDGDIQSLFDRASKLAVAGYPGNKPYGTLWTAKGNIIGWEQKTLRHTISTTVGQSGAPVFGINGSGSAVVIGVHSKEAVTGSLPSNDCRRVTPELIREIEQWRRQLTG